MTQNVLAMLTAIDPGILTQVARQSLGLPDFLLHDWHVAPLRHEKVIETTGGLFRFDGSGGDGSETKHWSAVLKIVNQPEAGCQEPEALCYWRREMLAYQTGMLAALPGAVGAPRCYGVSEQTHGGWIWLEDIQETSGPEWTLAHFQYSARKLGQLASAYLAGRPTPNAHWLCKSFFRSLYADDDWWAKFISPDALDNAWQRPVVQAVFSERLRLRVLQIWSEKWQWITANEGLPQVLCHNDAHRRNLMLRDNRDGHDELVMIDWGFCGPGGLGNDLGELVGTSLSYFALDPANANELEAAVLEGYLAGLRDAGWTGDERLARLGYLISLALYWGGTLPCEVALAQPEAMKVNAVAKYGRPVEKLLPGWAQLAEFALDRADEARYLIKNS